MAKPLLDEFLLVGQPSSRPAKIRRVSPWVNAAQTVRAVVSVELPSDLFRANGQGGG